jgi:hypothetical protein
MSGIPTKLTVRVIARDGKFLGDDIGGALVTVRDLQTGELLASGRTHGGSGPASLMTTKQTRNQPIPTQDPPDNNACRFDTELILTAPRLLEITAFGPLAAQQSATQVTATTWIYPGKDIAPGNNQREDGFLLEIPGLVVQVLSPPQHYFPTDPNPQVAIPILANVTMMCGCPIGATDSPWPYIDFEVVATVLHNGTQKDFPLRFVTPASAPSQFQTLQWTPGDYGVFEITVHAYQKSTGNIGVDRTSVNLVAPPPPK